MIVTDVDKDQELRVLKAKLLGSLLFFTQTFYKLKTGRDFYISNPIGRESHHITICRALTRAFHLQDKRIYYNLPPGHGKSTFLIYFVAWAFAHYADCNFLYVSYSSPVATEHTYTIKQIMQLPQYREFFGVEIATDSSAKDDFKTLQGGAVKAFGSQGSITGLNAGLPHLDRFSGALLIDDAHKPDEVHTDTIREKVIKNYDQTLKTRLRGQNVPIIGIGHRLHEADIFSHWESGKDGNHWEKLILPALDENNNVLDPVLDPIDFLKKEKEFNSYVYWSQYQQKPQPDGGGIFREDCFVLLDIEPKFLCTFITADTAETDKTYNDASVFSFWGLYEIEHQGQKTGELGLHWINCWEIRVEPAELEQRFLSFYSQCCVSNKKPAFVAIEKKSTGVTLLSVLKKMRGIDVRDITRTGKGNSKTARFLECQPYQHRRLISFTRDAEHVKTCITHCAKITANNTHAFDDICDTMADAVKIGLIEETVKMQFLDGSQDQKNLVKELVGNFNKFQNTRMMGYSNGLQR